MTHRVIKREKTEFKYVSKITYESGEVCFSAKFQRYNKNKGIIQNSKPYDCIRAAAIAVDKYLINQNKEPVNILKLK